ncbi:UDP-galactopyranose mutase [Polynucleobacter sp. MWH-Spelu-300-X4]|uniref:UDP-galactopyranose mutase n=1 Tax=Polynucleobacter sp. MWH-Spelu-300-X4 TaxID=2689109 RepID=UPI001BFE329E|nr:UDP-galactopyranose mutase [Polynucleobacter sp. MWH-Spelu-300-X4]QWD80067.1 UDP-galactopyranose mutase [Polynucleobacter sp. MWH-Spelu-300-X4]
MTKKYDFLIVGAGYAGAVCARQLADAGKKVLVLDKRQHIGGNAYDEKDENGVLIHPYGPHIFHTNSKKVFEYLSHFTDWRFYEHRVLARVNGQYYPIPINRLTINKVFGLNLKEEDVEAFLDAKRIPKDSVKTSEDVVLNSVGPELCEMFFRGYTKKQWNLDLSELSAGVAARIPTRTNDDDRYFTDTYQFMPAEGYTVMFEKILDSANIDVNLNVDFLADRDQWSYEKLIYTGPVDAFYDYCYGRLPYRSLSFEHQHLASVESTQTVGTVNYPNEEKFTRITEFKHLTGQNVSGTSIVREYSKAEGDPYYPVPNPNNEALYKKYQEKADSESGVYFVGRLAQYRYYNMDQVVASALSLVEKLI